MWISQDKINIFGEATTIDASHGESHEILMFVCLQKDAKQCCDAAKLNHTHCAGHRMTNR